MVFFIGQITKFKNLEQFWGKNSFDFFLNFMLIKFKGISELVRIGEFGFFKAKRVTTKWPLNCYTDDQILKSIEILLLSN